MMARGGGGLFLMSEVSLYSAGLQEGADFYLKAKAVIQPRLSYTCRLYSGADVLIHKSERALKTLNSLQDYGKALIMFKRRDAYRDGSNPKPSATTSKS